MALQIFLRSQCKLNSLVKVPSNYFKIERLSSSLVVPQKCVTQKNVPQYQNTTSLTFRGPSQNNLGVRFVHRVTAADDTSKSHGHHDKLWNAERLLSAALLGILPAGLMFPSQEMDVLMAISIIIHQYWGLEAVVVDYVRPSIFGNVIPKLALVVLLLFTASTLGGLFYFIYNDIGIARAIHKLWSIKGN